jgi:hypothetical protein
MGEIAAKAASLILIIVIGYVIKRIGWVKAEDFPKFSKIVLRITLPCALITSFNTFDITYNLLFLTAIGLIANLVLQITGYLVNQRKGGIAQAFGIINLGSYNVGAFAMPYIAGLMGPQSIIFASLFDVGNSFGAAGIGYGWSRSVADENQKTTLGGFLKLMFLSPLFDTYLLLLLMRLFGLQLPDAVITFTSTVGGANTFLAMLMIGIGFGIGLGCTPLQAGLQILGHPLRIFADLFHPDSTLPAGINGREDDTLHAVLFADRFHGDRIHRRSGRGCRNLRFHEFRLHSDRDLRDAVCAGGYGIKNKYRIKPSVLLVSVNQVWDFAVGIVTVVSLFAIILTILPRKGRRQPAHNKHPNKEKAENVTGSKGYFFNTGQHQFIFGTGKVNEVYDEFKQYTKMDESADTAFKEDVYSNMTPKSTTGFEVGIVSE